MAARKRKLELSDDWRERIRAGVLMDRLLKHVEGTLELSSTQIKAADILLRKIVPDLSQAKIDATVEHRYAMRLPQPVQKAEEWAAQNQATIN